MAPADGALDVIKDGRQMSPTLAGIRADHVARYAFAARVLRGWLPDGAPVLDIGCGCGYGSWILAERGGFRVIATDIDQGALDYGATHYAHRRISRLRLDLAADPLPAAAAVTGFEVVEHVADGAVLLARLPGEVLVGSVPNELVVPFDAAKHRRHVRHYTPEEIRTALTGAGWHAMFVGGQRGKHGRDARVDALPHECRTLVFEARRRRP